jgi:hypothetical protein
MAGKEFPYPFAGCTQSVAINPSRIERVLNRIREGCGEKHVHNFAVVMDAPWPVIFGSELLMGCIEKASAWGSESRD